MDNLIVRWISDNGKTFIASDGIDKKIEICEESKEIKNAKEFFREIIFNYFMNDCNKIIVLEDNSELQINEVRPIINELIKHCNDQLGKINKDGLKECCGVR